jgi:hypothetical protein
MGKAAGAASVSRGCARTVGMVMGSGGVTVNENARWQVPDHWKFCYAARSSVNGPAER